MNASLLFLIGFLLSVVSGVAIPIPPFKCPRIPPSPTIPTNVNQLRFSDIKVMMAAGDSISAGFAMIGYPPADFIENRDYVFSIGGASDAVTLVNWFKHYNPNIQGAATSWTWPLTKGDWLDAAVSMAKVEAVPDQIGYLVNTLKNTYKIKIDEHWKLLTLFIGANNICGACKGEQTSTPQYYETQLRNVLTLVEKNLPKTFVNLIAIFNISGVWDAGETKEYCRLIWDGITNSECGCLTTGKKSDRDAMDRDSVAFNQVMYQLAKEFQGHNNPNFTVVVQPGISGIPIAVYGESYLSELDCFHPNREANEAFTYAIWNNMQVPASQKSVVPDPNNIKILCPTETTFLQ